MDSSDDEAIRALIDPRADAVRAKDVEGSIAALARDIVTFDVVIPLRRIGSADVRTRVQQWFATFDGPIARSVDRERRARPSAVEGAFSGYPAGMNVHNIADRHDWFEVLVNGELLQTAVMDLEPGGGESGHKGNEHPRSEQVLFVVEGEVEAEIGDEKQTLRAGDGVIVPRGVAHRFTNTGRSVARTFNVYAPPAY